jgi:hypothetical protein
MLDMARKTSFSVKLSWHEGDSAFSVVCVCACVLFLTIIKTRCSVKLWEI